MNAPTTSLINTGTKLYLDSVLPEEIQKNLAWGAVGATSNPAIISGIISAGGADESIDREIAGGRSDSEIAWQLTDDLVRSAQQAFLPTFEETNGNAGWVSFELDPLLEDPDNGLTLQERTRIYVEQGKHWAEGQRNRMIKVPATPAGLAALEALAAAGITLNVTLIFTMDQYVAARDAIWAGAQKRDSLDDFKSVYSVFISRIDVYTQQRCPQLSDAAQGAVGLLNAKRIWQSNQSFWNDKSTRLEQELIFASTGVKDPQADPVRYVAALAGSDIQTNPPATNSAVADSGRTFSRTVDQMPPLSVQEEIDAAVDMRAMHDQLMSEGVAKFIQPQRDLLALISEKRGQLLSS
ncbi:MAG: transaldolase family protein [Planctomycetota bacterium]